MKNIFVAALLTFMYVPFVNAAMPAAAAKGIPTFQQEIARRRPVFTLYHQYADAVRTRGAQGLKNLTTPDFTLQGEAVKFKGAAAIIEMNKYLSLLDKNGQMTICLRRIEITGDTLVAYTEETIQGTRSMNKRQATISETWDWKQMWRRTTQGWKLFLDECLSETDAKKIKQDNPVRTISSGPDNAHSAVAAK